ncbi:MAG: hypothetical protein ACOX04_00120 [Candidatus Scatomorpha sp.]|jgi:hypothetical protein
MAKAGEVFDAALVLMDEGEGGSIAPEPDFSSRSLKLMNILRAEILSLLGDRTSYTPIESMESELEGLSSGFALGALPYGIAAHLLIDEQSAMSAFYHERYTELIFAFSKCAKSQSEDIKNLYRGEEEWR